MQQRYTHLLVLDFEVMTYIIDKQRYTHLLVFDFEVMTYTIDKGTDVLDVDSTTSTEKSKVTQIYCQSHLKTILHRFFNTSQKYCQLMNMVLISKI